MLNWIGVTLANIDAGSEAESDAHLPQLYGYTVALASVACELRHTECAVPNDLVGQLFDRVKVMTGTATITQKIHPRKQVCGFLLMESLMQLGDDYLAPRVKSLLNIWERFALVLGR